MIRTRPLAAAAIGALLMCLTVASCGGDETVSVNRQSPERGATGQGLRPTGEYVAYCARAAVLADESVDLDDDLQEVLDLLDEVAGLAPAALTDDFAALIDLVEQLSTLGESDPAAFAKVFELMFDPALMESMAAIDEFTMTECGFALDTAGPALDVPGPGAGEPGD